MFKYNQDVQNITQVKDFFDSVNRRKWLNCYFYTFKPNNNCHEHIVTALSDSNTLEIVFIDILTGYYFKRLDPIKYHCSDFICHYKNHFSLVIQSNKKLLLATGYFLNNHGTYSPKFKYIENNIEYIEEEDFFEKFQKSMKKLQNKVLKPIDFNEIFMKKRKKVGFNELVKVISNESGSNGSNGSNRSNESNGSNGSNGNNGNNGSNGSNNGSVNNPTWNKKESFGKDKEKNNKDKSINSNTSQDKESRVKDLFHTENEIMDKTPSEEKLPFNKVKTLY